MKRTIIYITVLLLWSSLITELYANEPILSIDPQGHSGMIQDVMFTPDGKMLISVSLDKTIRIWSVETGDLLRTLRIPIGKGIEGMIHAGALSPDGKILAVAGWPGGGSDHGIPVYLLGLETGEMIAALTGHEDVISALDFSQDGKWLVSGGDTTVRLWDLTAKNTVLILKGHKEGVTDVAISSDGRKIASSTDDGTFRIWEISKDHLSIIKTHKNKMHESGITAIVFAPNDKTIVTAGGDYQIILWNTKAKIIKKISAQPYPCTMAFSEDSQKLLVAGTEDAPAIIYDVDSGEELINFKDHTNVVIASVFYKNNLIATAGGNDKDIYIWYADTGKVKTHIAGQGQAVWSIAFGEGRNIAFGNTNTAAGKVNRGEKKFTQFSDYPEYVPFDLSFDFTNMLLIRTSPEEKAFERSKIVYNNQQLKRLSWDNLHVTGGGNISHKGFGAHWIRAYTFTRQGTVATGFESWIRTYQQDGKLLWEKSEHTGQTWAFAVSKDGQILASASDDQTVKLWNVKTGECLSTLFVTRDYEWVCWTPQGYYTASAGGEKYIGWHVNQGLDKAAKFYPVSVFRKRFHNPNLVKQTIVLGSFEKALAACNDKTRNPIKQTSVLEVLPPKIQWVLPHQLRTISKDESFRVRADIISSGSITDIRILVNGRIQASGRGLSVVKQQSVESIDKAVALTPGENKIQIFVANGNAGTTSKARTVLYEKGDNWLKPNIYMIAVGISKYRDQSLDLEYADDDAKAMTALFQSQKDRLYKNVTIKELYDDDATRNNILDALEWLEQETTQKDIAVIFMAAHGVNDNRGRFYLLPYDGSPERLRRSAVDWGEFIDVLGNLPSKVLFFLDTCHSGQLGKNMFQMRGSVDNTEAIRELSSDENGVIILAASTGQEYSLEHPDWGHGAFTKALLEGLKSGKADYSKDGIIHLRELDTYISERVKKLTGGRQHPTTLKPSTISRFPIVQIGNQTK